MLDERIPTLPIAASRRPGISQVVDSPRGVGGWLALFCIGLTILAPLFSLIQMTLTWEQAKPAFDQFPSLKSAIAFENLGCVALLIYGFVVGCTLMRGSPSGPKLAKQYLLIRLLSSIGIELIAVMLMADLPSNVTAGAGGALVRVIFYEGGYFLIWWFYFKNSKRVRNAYGDENSLSAEKPYSIRNTAKVEEESIPYALSASRRLVDERITALPVAPTNSTTDVEWFVIHAGEELGPLSLAELVGKAAIGEIEADDLVKTAGGLWTKARDFDFLQQQFRLKNSRANEENLCHDRLPLLVQQHFLPKNSREEANPTVVPKPDSGWVNYPNRIHGNEALVFGGFLLLVLFFLGVWWANSKSTNPAQEVNSMPGNSALEANSRGLTWAQKKEYGNAIKDYNEAIRLDPKNASFFNNRGTAWLNKKEYDNAIADFDVAIRLNPQDVLPFWNRGCAWAGKNDYDRAIKDFSDGIRLDPTNAILYSNRGNDWMNKRDYDKAITDFDEAIRLDPSNASFFNGRGRAWYEKDEDDKAIKDFDEAIRIDPADASAFLYRSYAWYEKKDNDKAMKDYNEAIRLNPKNAGSLTNPSSAQWLKAAARL